MSLTEVVSALAIVAGIILSLATARNSVTQTQLIKAKQDFDIQIAKQKQEAEDLAAAQKLKNDSIDLAFDRLTSEIKRQGEEIKRLEASNTNKAEEIERLFKAQTVLRDDIAKRDDEIYTLRRTNANLTVRVAELEARNAALEVRVTELTVERDAALNGRATKPATGPLADKKG